VAVTVNGIKYYRTAEVCQLVGIGRSTLLRWFRDGVISTLPRRDRRGWRLFTDTDIRGIQDEVNRAA